VEADQDTRKPGPLVQSIWLSLVMADRERVGRAASRTRDRPRKYMQCMDRIRSRRHRSSSKHCPTEQPWVPSAHLSDQRRSQQTVSPADVTNRRAVSGIVAIVDDEEPVRDATSRFTTRRALSPMCKCQGWAALTCKTAPYRPRSLHPHYFLRWSTGQSMMFSERIRHS